MNKYLKMKKNPKSMTKEKFLLVSLQEDKAKKLAQVVTNDNCRRILDYLADREATETDLAKKLNLPISTVHYNLKQLVYLFFCFSLRPCASARDSSFFSSRRDAGAPRNPLD